MSRRILLIVLIALSLPTLAQKEKGKVVSAPKIPHNTKSETPKVDKKDEFDFIFEDEPKLRFSNQYDEKTNKNTNESTSVITKGGIKIEPLRELNEVIHEDTSSIDEGELMIVEIEEEAQFAGSENLVNLASYFSVWDTKSLDPYGIKPGSSNEVVNITLFNEKEGRNWAPMLDNFRLTSHFGWRNRRWHKGTDLSLNTGDKVYAAFDGIVRISGTYNGYGRTVMLRHYNGLETLYGHLSKTIFEPNTLVKAGDAIGLGGSTGRSSGPHLHYELRYEGNQFDSENMYDYSNNQIKIRGPEFTLSSKLYDYLRGGKSVVTHSEIRAVSSEEDLDDNGDSEDEEFVEEVPQKIEQKVWYTVRRGDTLMAIARKSKMSLRELTQLNKIPTNKKIYPGLRLRIR